MLIILKTYAKTDTSTLIERLKQATIVNEKPPWKWKSQVSKAIEYYSPKEDQLVLNAWVDYVLTLDCQPLDWNMATILSTFCHGSIFIDTVAPKLKSENEQKAIIYPLVLATDVVRHKLRTVTKQEFDVMFKRL
ncbi:hypothetical protein Plhal304r1_c054g0139391 [Plasmopara halstedii]